MSWTGTAMCQKMHGVVNISECARLAGVCPTKAAKAVACGLIPGPTHQFGGRRRYYSAEEAHAVVELLKKCMGYRMREERRLSPTFLKK